MKEDEFRPNDQVDVSVEIIRFHSDDQPGWVECRLVDCESRGHSFVEKIPVVTTECLGPDTLFPQPGTLAARVVEMQTQSDGRRRVVVDTVEPWGIESVTGETRFLIALEQIEPGSTNRPADDWPFDQPPNCAVFTIREIANGSQPVLHVTHDRDDHGWQFLGFDDARMEDAFVVKLLNIVSKDPSLKELANLPPGWHAWRKNAQSEWVRAPNPTATDDPTS